MHPDHLLPVTYYRSVRNPEGKADTVTWHDLAGNLQRHKIVATKEDRALWSPHRLDPEHPRRGDTERVDGLLPGTGL